MTDKQKIETTLKYLLEKQMTLIDELTMNLKKLADLYDDIAHKLK